MHISELFHGMYEISKAVAGPLASQERAFEKELTKTEEKVKKVVKKHGENSEQAIKAIATRNLAKLGLDMRKYRRKKAKDANRELSNA